jgi:hypothetical protein
MIHGRQAALRRRLLASPSAYQELLKKFSADDLAKRLEFWFVTNRPISADVAEAVTDAANGAAARHPDELKKLERFAGLAGDSLSAFCKLLHFEDRQDGYWDQRNILIQDVNGYLPDADIDAPMQLKELVTRKALTEFEQNPVITKMDVLRVLKTDETRLFPANNLIRQVGDAVAREQESELVQSIVQVVGRPVVIHAAGGVGKSVFATCIAPALPAGSVAVLYDCFGNGQYRSATGYRHRHKDALVQIANELAAKGLCHPLIPSHHADASAYVCAFFYRLHQAVTILQRAKEGALLCVVIDAADNAQMAAEEIGEARSFARDLIRQSVPDGIRFVFLCRSHRQAMLDPPAQALRLELRPFSRDETAAYLRKTFKDATEGDIDEFHRLSSQNPRVQALALSRNLPLAETLRLLGPNPTTVESAIGSLLNEAIAKLRDSVGPLEKGSIDKICAGLAALRPLIPIPVLSAMSGVEDNAIKSFAYDVGRPLLVAGETIQFIDEPAETWFREQFKPNAVAMAAFIDDVKPLAATSAYVASALPQLMLEAGQFVELVALALTSAALPETSPLEKRDVELQRLQFALKATLRTGRYLEAAKLSLKAGGETAGDERQTKLLQANTDLVAAFIETDIVQEIVSRRTFGSGWVGSHHAYEAALLSGQAELVGDARSRLRMAHEWLQNWSRLSVDERKNETISDKDIAELAMAHLNIHGPEQAAAELRSWTPREVSYRVGRNVARRLVDHGRFKELDEFALAAGNDLGLVLAIILELRAVQRRPPICVTRRAFRLVAHSRIKLRDTNSGDMGPAALAAIAALVEAAIMDAVCTSRQANAVLTRYLPSEPPRDLSSRFSGSRSSLIQGYALRAALTGSPLHLNDLAYPELRMELETPNRHHSSRDAHEFEEDVGALLPWHQLWASTLLGGVTLDNLKDRIETTRQASTRAARIHYRDDLQTSDEIARLWLDVLHKLGASEGPFIDAYIQWMDGLKRPLYTPTLNALARLAAQSVPTRILALNLAMKSFSLTRDAREDAESKADGYIAAARAVLAISPADAKAFFNQAVEVASKIGDENLARWDAILDLANRAARPDRPAPIAAYNLARCGELTYDYVARDKHFAWNATVKALAALCPASVLAILSRWRDRGFGSAQRLLPVATEFLAESGSLDARDALPLIGLRAEWDDAAFLQRVLEKCASRNEKQYAAELCYHYLKWEGTSSAKWRGVKNAAARHSISLPDLDGYIAHADTAERVAEERKEQTLASTTTRQGPRDWEKVFSGADLSSVSGIAQSYKAFKETEVPWDHGEFFAEACRHVPAGFEPSFIEAAGKVPEFDLYHFRCFLEQVPAAWRARLAVTQALASTLKVFCRRCCMKIKKSRYYEVLPFDLACEVSGLAETDIIKVVIDAVGESPEMLDAERLFSLVGLLTSTLTHDEALKGLMFGLGLFDAVLEDKDGDGHWSDKMCPPDTLAASIAGYIWAGLSDPTSILRWESAHVVLAVCGFGRHEVLKHLMDLAVRRTGSHFVDARLPYYELHALQWLLIALARAANEFPSALAPYGDRIVGWALNDQPHVMIRAFAARAALALIEARVLPDEDALRVRLLGVNISTLPVIESKSFERRRAKSGYIGSSDDDDRFYFGIDMGPYWYEPLGRIFALGQTDVEAQALRVIRNDLAATTKGKWDEDQRQRQKHYAYEQTSHSHGSYPRTDDFRFYLSYHAMMIVAGRLLATIPTHCDTEYGEKDEFGDWLRRHDLSRQDGRWLSDRRDPTPLECPAWRDRKKEDPSRGVVTDADFDEMLRSGEMMAVWGHWTTADSNREQSAHVYSALVPPDKSMALLRALQTAKDVFDYGLPSADGRLEINVPGYELKGWLSDDSRDSGLDEKDYWSGGVRFPPPVPAPYIIELMAITSDSDRRVWRNAQKHLVMASQVWGHFDLGERHADTNPERGNRIQASMSFIVEMLGRLRRDLIVQVQIERQKRYRSYESSERDDKERIRNQARLYLIRADGSVSTLRENLGVGTKAR